MVYSKYIDMAKRLTISYNADSMTYYLEPDWQTILHANGLGNLEDVEDMYIDGWYDLEDVLKLEVEKRNAIASKKNAVLNWVYGIITSTADPAMTEMENDLFQKMFGLTEQAKNDENKQ